MTTLDPPQDRSFRGSGAHVKNHIPDQGRARRASSSSRQRAEHTDELIFLKRKENELNALFISATAISASILFCIVHNIRNLQAMQQPGCSQALYAAVRLYKSQIKSSSPTLAAQTPTPSILSSACSTLNSPLSHVIRMNMYWATGLVFSVSAVFLAMFAKQRVRDHRRALVLQRDAHPPESTPTRNSSVDPVQAWSISVAMDSMYRLFQVALIVFLLGHFDAIVVPIGVTVFAPIVVCGMFYVFGVIGPGVDP
ncbi:hypothetical protein F5148DRAFT_1149384 [Russula earlei]|uniref:Uncharacterized protein n=1 Tax=Russula earlei TaxID=71964 RepID=A0ACC0U8I9_9AGAM|nr:hypothetical protein F5148DRAFT_1149384 [Russula earlei]